MGRRDPIHTSGLDRGEEEMPSPQWTPQPSRGSGGGVRGITAAQPPQRTRQWDQDNQHLLASYRGIPPWLQDAIKTVAGHPPKEGVPIITINGKDYEVPIGLRGRKGETVKLNVGEVARAFLEKALIDYLVGEYEPLPHPTVGKWTLFPED
jgi:hypothetical protein